MNSCFIETSKLPAWPTSIPRVFQPLAKIKLAGLDGYTKSDIQAILEARRVLRKREAIQNSATTGTWSECLFRNYSDYTAVTAASETTMLGGGGNLQPAIPALFFNQVAFRTISILARGVLTSTSGSPTTIVKMVLGTTAGSSNIGSTVIGISPTITMAASQTNVFWESRLDLTCTVSGFGSSTATLAGAGYIKSPAGFPTPFEYPLEPTTPNTATWTVTFDGSVTQYFNMSNTFGGSSNSITLKQLIVMGLN